MWMVMVHGFLGHTLLNLYNTNTKHSISARAAVYYQRGVVRDLVLGCSEKTSTPKCMQKET